VHFEDLVQFLERDMRMSHVYQPVMLRLLLRRNGRASVQDVARALLNEDRSQQLKMWLTSKYKGIRKRYPICAVQRALDRLLLPTLDLATRRIEGCVISTFT
jgi:hypothetical protein